MIIKNTENSMKFLSASLEYQKFLTTNQTNVNFNPYEE